MEPTGNATISIETKINAPIEKVWKAWTDPAIVANWFGSDPGGKVLKAELDVRAGGRFEVSFRDSDHTTHTCSGVYREVREFRKLSFSWVWQSEPGFESFVIVALAVEGDGTRMQFTHTNLGTESKHDYLSGWQRTFSKLERLLAGENK